MYLAKFYGLATTSEEEVKCVGEMFGNPV